MSIMNLTREGTFYRPFPNPQPLSSVLDFSLTVRLYQPYQDIAAAEQARFQREFSAYQKEAGLA